MSAKFSIIIPCYNEASNIPEIISQIEILCNQQSFEFIFVNNGSTDESEEILSSTLSENIKVIHLPQNAGYGGGIKAGIQQARGQFIGWIHADLQYSLIDSLSSLGFFTKNFAFIKGKRRGRKRIQSILTLIMSLFESLLFRCNLNDINAQPTVFHRDLLQHASNMPDDFSIDLYTYLMARKFGFSICRFEVIFAERKHGKSSWNTGVKSVFRMSTRTIRYSLSLRRSI